MYHLQSCELRQIYKKNDTANIFLLLNTSFSKWLCQNMSYKAKNWHALSHKQSLHKIPKFCRNDGFSRKFHTRKLEEMLFFFRGEFFSKHCFLDMCRYVFHFDIIWRYTSNCKRNQTVPLILHEIRPNKKILVPHFLIIKLKTNAQVYSNTRL